MLSQMVRSSFLGYLPLFTRDEPEYEGKMQCMKFWARQDGIVTMDWTHLYFTLFFKPWQSPWEYAAKKHKEWFDHCRSCDLASAMPEGTNPQCTLQSFWGLLALMVSARSVSTKLRTSLVRITSTLGASCAMTGDLQLPGQTLPVQDGKVNLNALLKALFADKKLQSVFLDKLPPTLVASRDVNLLSVLLLSGRFCSLNPRFDVGEAWRTTLSVVKQGIALMEQSLMSSKVRLHKEVPASAVTRYWYRRGKSITNADSRVRLVVLADDDRCVEARRAEEYALHNVLYLSTGTRPFALGFAKFGSVSLVADEVAFRNTKALQVFSSVFLADDVPFGLALPPQLMQPMAVDFQRKKIEARIRDIWGNVGGHPDRGASGRGGRGGRGRGGQRKRGRGSAVRPQGDPLVATYHVCLAFDNALRAITDKGLQHFQQPAAIKRAAAGFRLH